MEDNDELKAPTTRDVGLQYGAILGVVSILFFLIPTLLDGNPFKSPWNWIGAAATLATIFLAHKKFKDEGDGFMSYGQGIGIAFWLALSSIVLSLLFSYCYINFIDNAPFETFMLDQEDEMIAKNMPNERMEMALGFTRKYFWYFGFFGGLLFNMIIALVLTIFTKKQNPEAPF